MKRLFLIWIFSGSLDSFSQVNGKVGSVRINQNNVVQMTPGAESLVKPISAPDTQRAIILVTLSPNGIAHARMGFVVIEPGKRPVYLDCRKKALKLPQVGWRYEIVDTSYKKL